VAVTAQGVSLVAWTETDTHSVVKAQWMVPASMPLALSDASLDCWSPKVAVDGSGGAMLVWSQYDGGMQAHVWGRRWNGSAWTVAVQISANTLADASMPELACDAAGNAFALWHEGNGVANHFDVHAAHFSAGAWGAPALLSDGVKSAYNPKVAMAAAGTAVAVWTQAQDDGSTSNGPQDTWAAPFSSGAWAAPTQLNAISGATAWVYGQTAVGIDASGRAVALWIQSDATGTGPFQTWAAAYAPGSGWGASTMLSLLSAGGDSYAPSVALDASGHAVAVWQQQDGVSTAAIAASRLSFGGAWSAPQLLSSGGIAYDPHAAFGASGEATVYWYQDETPNFPLRFATSSGSAWGAPGLVDTLVPSFAQYPVVRAASNPAGAPVVVWGLDSM
jgi:hypothetical protein